VLSAYKKIGPFIGNLVMSFRYKRGKSVPGIDPLGTPDFISVHLDEKKLFMEFFVL
jgi:hypothetical protein